jgi:hypothetical protein
MAFITRKLLVGAGAASAITAGGIAYWVSGKTKNLPVDQRGSVLPRMKEIVFAFQQSKKIQDEYTAWHHQDLVSSLSSKQFTVTSDKGKKEIDTLRTSYYAGYISEALQRNPGVTPPIFRYDENLPVLLPSLPGETHAYQGFVFAGSSPEVHDAQARSSILDGDYIRCKSELEIADPKKKDSLWNKRKEVDVLVTGTTDPRKCNQFKNAFLRDVAYQAARSHQPVDPESPYSDTPVFNCSEKGFEATGDLTDIPETAKRHIRLGDFTACNFYSLQKTRQSGGRYKEVGAIAAGTTNDEVCQSLHFGHMRKLIDQTQKQQE